MMMMANNDNIIKVINGKRYNGLMRTSGRTRVALVDQIGNPRRDAATLIDANRRGSCLLLFILFDLLELDTEAAHEKKSCYDN